MFSFSVGWKTQALKKKKKLWKSLLFSNIYIGTDCFYRLYCLQKVLMTKNNVSYISGYPTHFKPLKLLPNKTLLINFALIKLIMLICFNSVIFYTHWELALKPSVHFTV